MKKFLSIITSAVLVASLAGCVEQQIQQTEVILQAKITLLLVLLSLQSIHLLKTVVKALFRVLLKQAIRKAKTLLLTTKMLKPI